MAKSTAVETKPIAIVVWDDAHGTSTKDISEANLDQAHSPCVMKTMGWLLKQDEKGVSVAAEVYYDENVAYYRGHTFIPAPMVRSVSLFKLSKAKVKESASNLLGALPSPSAVPG